MVCDSNINNMTKAEPEAETEAETTEETRRVWRSCCMECDRQVVQFIVKTIFAGSILGFACIMIATDADPTNSPLLSWYTSMIGLVAGSYIEQGTSMQGRKQNE